jgi:hypothetical protein
LVTCSSCLRTTAFDDNCANNANNNTQCTGFYWLSLELYKDTSGATRIPV